jgi:glycosyltransferase involved in cell wall biosynthesis
MKILIISQYFWPENFKINDVVLGLKERGHHVSVLTAKPNYPDGNFSKGYGFLKTNYEKWNGISIYRTPIIRRGNGSSFRLVCNFFSFMIMASFRVMFIKGEFDKIFVYEPSPVLVGIPAIVAKYKFKAPIYFWVQDLWPESISAAGGFKNKWIIWFVDKITRRIYHSCKKILVQSKRFIPYIKNQGIHEDKLVYHPNSTESFYKPVKLDSEILKTLPTGKKIMFAGNLGESQSFETLLISAQILKKRNKKINWIILGNGRMKSFIKQKIKEFDLEENFILLGSFPSHDMPKFFSCADALLVSLKKNPIFSLTIPNKIQSYMACEKPIIASIDGEGGDIIKESKSGLVSSAEDSVGLANNLELFLKLSKEDVNKMSKNSLKFFKNEFDREKLLTKLIHLFDEK